MNPIRSVPYLTVLLASAGCAAPSVSGDSGRIPGLVLDDGFATRALPDGEILVGTRGIRDAAGARPFVPGTPWDAPCAPILPDAACRPALAWADAGIEEWFLAEPAGLRQGWRVHDAPDGPFVLEVEIEGGWPVATGRRDIIAVEFDDGRTLQYRGLSAWDADGVPLPAAMAPDGGMVLVTVDLSGAALPVTIDPVLSAASTTRVGTRVAGFGRQVVGAGDMTGDGYDDIVVSAIHRKHGLHVWVAVLEGDGPGTQDGT